MSQFNGSGMPTMGRRNQRPMQPMQPTVAQPVQPNLPMQARQPAAATQGTPSPAPVPNIPNVYQRQAIAANMANRVTANARAQANPATANLPHVQAAMAGRNIMNELEAERMGMGQNYFQGREMVADANTRANEANMANVGQSLAQTDQTRFETEQGRVMLPGRYMGQEIDNQMKNQGVARAATENQYLPGQLQRKAEAETVQNQYLPGQLQTDIQSKQAGTGKTKAETDQIAANTGRIQNKDDAKTIEAQTNAKWQAKYDALQKQYADLIAKMNGAEDPVAKAMKRKESEDATPPAAETQQQQGQAATDRKFQNGQKPQDGWKPGDEATTPQGTFRFDAKGGWVKVG